MARRTTRKPPPRVGQVGISFDPNEKARALRDLEEATTIKERAEAMSDLIAVQSGGTRRSRRGKSKASAKAAPKAAPKASAKAAPKASAKAKPKAAPKANVKLKRLKAAAADFEGMKIKELKGLGTPMSILPGVDPDVLRFKASGMDLGSAREAAALAESTPMMDYEAPIGPSITPKQLKQMRERVKREQKKQREQEKREREKSRKAAKAEKEREKKDTLKATLAMAKAAAGKEAKDRTPQERRALQIAARISAAAQAERERKATFKRAKSRALMLSGGAGLKPAKFGNSCSRTPPPASKCRTKGEVRLLATALKLDACKPGVLPTQFGRRAGEYIELMKYQKAPRQFMPAPYVDSIMPRKEQVVEVRLRDGKPVISKTTGKPIPKKVIQVPSYGGLVRLARRLPPGGVRKMLMPEG